MAFSFNDKVAVVTGGGSGIGQATVWAFAEAGARVIAADINEAGLSATLKSPAAHGRVTTIRCDVTREADVSEMVAAAQKAGGPDVAVNCAGIDQVPTPFEQMSIEAFDKVMRVNAFGVWLCMKLEATAMLKHGRGGAIVNVASIAGLVGPGAMAGYVASKHACVGLTRSASIDLAPRGIRVNAICPGPVATPMLLGVAGRHEASLQQTMQMLPAGRMSQPSEIADGILYLASDNAKFVIGATLTIDGGMTVA